MIKLRLPLENNKYTYILAKATFTEQVEIHLVDRLKPKSSVSIIETISEVQEQILHHLGIDDNILQFLKDSKWILYGKEGEMFEYRFGELIEISSRYSDLLDNEIMEQEVNHRLPFMEIEQFEQFEQLSLF